MWSDFRILQLYVAIYVSLIKVLSGDASGTCVAELNTTSGRYFNAFESLETTSKHAFGCATVDKPRVSSDSTLYRENHVIDIENDRANDIYLNVNGIPYRTTDSLPQYQEYRYEFALFSEKDVIWLISLRNMPNSSVSFLFYFSPGSQVIARDGNTYPSINVGIDRRHMTAQTLLLQYKMDVFKGEEITSFSRILNPPRVAAINITIGPKQDVLEPWPSNFTSSCNKLEKGYESPVVSLKKYEESHKSFACEREVSPEAASSGRCFIIVMKAEGPVDNERQQVIDLEVIGAEASEHNDRADEEAIIVLRSSKFTQWRVHIGGDLKSRSIKFVIGLNDQLEGNGIAEVIGEDLNYDENDYEVVARDVEARYGCVLMSYAQYDSPTELIFLSLTESDDSIGGTIYEPDYLADKANDIFRQSVETCAVEGWTFRIPSSALEQYGLSAANVKMSVGSSTCFPMEDGDFITFTQIGCGLIADNAAAAQLKVIFRTRGKHLLLSPVAEKEEVTIPVQCSNSMSGSTDTVPENGAWHNMKTMCEDLDFFVEIDDEDKQYLDISGISKCENQRLGYSTEYKFQQYYGESCGATFDDGIFRITIPAKKNVDGVPEDPVELFCKPVKVATEYKLEVFKDYNMRNPVNSSGQILVELDQGVSDTTTYHIKVSLDSNYQPLMVYLSQCSLTQGPKIVQRLIKNNCLASRIVSFVRSPTRSSSQHFAVNLGDIIKEYERLQIKCEVSACSIGEKLSELVIKPPQCIHLNGDSCSRGDSDARFLLAPYHAENVYSGFFQSAPERKIDGKNSPSITTPILVIIAVCAFVLGCISVAFICLIDKRYKRNSLPDQRKIPKSNPDVSGESGSSRSTGSTKTYGSSFSSFFCLKTGKSSSSSSPTSSKDNLEMRPFIPNSTTATQPQITNVRSKKTAESTTGTDPISSRQNSDYTQPINSTLTSEDVGNGKGILVLSEPMPHLRSTERQTSSDHTRLQCEITLSRGTSLPPHDCYCNDQLTASLVSRDEREFDCPLGVSQDEFYKLKEEAV